VNITGIEFPPTGQKTGRINIMNTNVIDPSVAEQCQIRLQLPAVESNVDYHRQVRLLDDIDGLLLTSGVELQVMDAALAAESAQAESPLSAKECYRCRVFARRSLRCTIARLLSGESFRSFSIHVADSHLLRRFCGYDGLADQSPSKSTLQRMMQVVDTPAIRSSVVHLIQQARRLGPDQKALLGMPEVTTLDQVYVDSTCLPLDIHYPTDWVLLRDLTKSMTQCIDRIRKCGLRCRMQQAASFRKVMNKLCMAMTEASRQRGGKAKRKGILRAMKKHVRTVMDHGQRHLDKLNNQWMQTDLTAAQKDHIVLRLKNLIAIGPSVIKQAHERIIGERPVSNGDKILSIHEVHAAVYVRGKAGADCEFGLQLQLAENSDGLIVDWDIPNDGIHSDSAALIPGMDRLIESYGDSSIQSVIADRGYNSKKNAKALKTRGLEDLTLPRNPQELQKSMKIQSFAAYHCRRAQTEARIGIFKNCFAGQKIPAKGLNQQQQHVAWAVLTHNLWVLARHIEAGRVASQSNAA